MKNFRFSWNNTESRFFFFFFGGGGGGGETETFRFEQKFQKLGSL